MSKYTVSFCTGFDFSGQYSFPASASLDELVEFAEANCREDEGWFISDEAENVLASFGFDF